MIPSKMLFALALALAPLPALPAWAQAPQAGQAAPAPVTIGDIVISGAFTRATLPHAPVGGGFFTLTNKGGVDDVLVSAQADFAGATQIHQMQMQGDVMKMSPLADGLVIPAGQSVTLAPGGYHLMFMGLKTPLVEGETVPVTLNFARAGSIRVTLAVAGTAADAPAEAMRHEEH